MNKIVIAYVALVAASTNVVADSVMYGTAYEAIDGVPCGRSRDRGQFEAGVYPFFDRRNASHPDE